jgi:3-methyladenine DNA glycosylase/8-oxoguanine DNA glycosylase
VPLSTRSRRAATVPTSDRPVTAAVAALATVWRPAEPVDLRLSLSALRRGSGDPTHRVTPDGVVWRTLPTPAGPATLALAGRDGEVHATAWGPGAEWAIETMPDLCGRRDDPSGFDPAHPLVRQAWRRARGLRLPRTGLVFDQLVPTVLEQKVTTKEARRSYRELVWRFGTPAPGPVPSGLRVAPGAELYRRLPSWEWHRAGVDAPRRNAIVAAATAAGRLEECTTLPLPDAYRRLRVIPGVGIWTAAYVAAHALGDADAVPVGDLHLPGWVGRALTGEPQDDDGMLAALAPFAPHRHRVIRLIGTAGFGKDTGGRRAPHVQLRDYRRW